MQNIDQVLCEVCSYHAVWHIAYANGCLGWVERRWPKLSLVGIVFESFQEIETTRGCELYAGIDVVPPRKHTHTHKLQRASGDTILTRLLISSSYSINSGHMARKNGLCRKQPHTNRAASRIQAVRSSTSRKGSRAGPGAG